MSGHSKWSTIKHKKAASDVKRGKIFTKIIKEITVAARMGGGGDPNANPRLRAAIQAAKTENMPKDNIERAIKKGTGDLEGVSYDESIYEGYGPGGAAVLVDSLTDNKKGYIVVERAAVSEDTLMEAALEAGAEDVREDDDNFEVIAAPEDFEEVKAAIEKAGIPTVAAEVTMLPQSTTSLADKEAEQMVRLMEMLEDCEDVQKVYTNADLPEEYFE
jgi:transcriptional/translational regulatory protein YebC/TACO1